jgi:GTP-binding protein
MAKLIVNKIFNGNAEFLLGVNNLSQLPQFHFPEIAFIGASNVGKSSLINALIGKRISIVSATKGRTKQLNFFKILGFKDGFYIVDMPGYGFAQDAKTNINHWQELSLNYLANRKNLKRAFLLIDAQKGMKDLDCEIVEFFNVYNVPFQIILTKIDKLNLAMQKQALEKIQNDFKLYQSFCSTIVSTSSSKGYGIFDLQNEIVKILENL